MEFHRRPDPPSGTVQRRPRRVQTRVALELLEALREQDRPEEVLDDENITITMPRRLGLSLVVDSQIRRYKQEARRGQRVPESEVRDLIHLVARRPDGEEVFRQVGRSLAGSRGRRGWRRIYPTRLSFALARGRMKRRLRVLFGGSFSRTAGVPFQMEASDDILLAGDPGGSACALVDGLAEAILEEYGRGEATVVHSECRSRGDRRCLWILSTTESTHSGEPGPSSRESAHVE